MTIKRRLFLSNILMLVLPVVISCIAVPFTLVLLVRLNGGAAQQTYLDVDQFYRAMERVDTMLREEGLDALLPPSSMIRRDLEKAGLVLAVYRGEEQLYAMDGFQLTEFAAGSLVSEENTMRIQGTLAVYAKSVGDCRLLLTNAHNMPITTMQEMPGLNLLVGAGCLAVLLVILIVLLTNRFLTRFVFKRIMHPVDTLVYGVRQIRDGNLDYRIDYKAKDEFAPVCADFNEMAERLSDMVEHRVRDEENRKELIAGISHDLRTPLTSIKAYLEGLEQGVASTPELQQKYVDTIKMKTDDLAHIINQLFLFSKLDLGEYPLRLETVNLGRYLEDLADALREEYAQKGLTLTCVPLPSSLNVRLDVVQMKQVITNVLENSLKYCGEAAEVRLGLEEVDGMARVTLADNGPGVAEGQLEKIFDVFYRGDKARAKPEKGSGLGLAISRKVMERFGGSICAKNAPEGGLVTVLTLPLEGKTLI